MCSEMMLKGALFIQCLNFSHMCKITGLGLFADAKTDVEAS